MKAKIKIDDHAVYLYSGKKSKIFWDVESYRPDPRSHLKMNITYQGNVERDVENLPDGTLIHIPKEIIIGKMKFVMVR